MAATTTALASGVHQILELGDFNLESGNVLPIDIHLLRTLVDSQLPQ
ncbi:MAG: hypothetical protein ACI8RT_000398 [Candidatus Azotimanducaceae bacterium]|jgi:hypothetical protein|tara:strand:+ start:511 stop:651 length:141 start_codon:yes stop_codon:yes gene_type:complete